MELLLNVVTSIIDIFQECNGCTDGHAKNHSNYRFRDGGMQARQVIQRLHICHHSENTGDFIENPAF